MRGHAPYVPGSDLDVGTWFWVRDEMRQESR